MGMRLVRGAVVDPEHEGTRGPPFDYPARPEPSHEAHPTSPTTQEANSQRRVSLSTEQPAVQQPTVSSENSEEEELHGSGAATAPQEVYYED